MGTLVLPLLARFGSEDLVVSLVDLHEESMECVKVLLDHFGFLPRTRQLVCGDATTVHWDSPADLILTETMGTALGREPQVTISQALNHPEPLLNVPNLLGHQIDQYPTVSLTSPSDGAPVSGIITLQAEASDDYAVTQVEFFVGGVSVGVDTDSSDGYWLNWNSELVPDGDHEISAVATDDASQTSTSSILVSVDNIDSAPVADAGPDQIVQDADASGNEWIVLDGSGSSDDRGILSYAWKEGGQLINTGVSLTVDLPVGVHTITLVVTDLIGLTAQDIVEITVEEAPPVGAQVSVASISLIGYGGKNRNNNLQALASIVDDLEAPVAGAVVEADLYRDGTKIKLSTSTTDSSGSALLFDERKIATGCYSVVITNVTAAGLTFDEVTPSNNYCK
jgi:hypothetical protein